MNSNDLPAQSLDLADKLEQYLFRVHGHVDLRILFTSLLLVSSKIAHSQGMSNVEFRRIARDVYRHQEKEYEAIKRGG